MPAWRQACMTGVGTHAVGDDEVLRAGDGPVDMAFGGEVQHGVMAVQGPGKASRSHTLPWTNRKRFGSDSSTSRSVDRLPA